MKIIELNKEDLNYWVARALGAKEGSFPKENKDLCGIGFEHTLKTVLYGNGTSVKWDPCNDWSQGGPIIETQGVWLFQPEAVEESAGEWNAICSNLDAGVKGVAYDSNPLIAAMRAFVSSIYGEEIPSNNLILI